MKKLILIFSLTLASTLCCQNTFQKVLSSDSTEVGMYTSITNNGSFYVGGYSNLFDPTSWDSFVIKFDSLGDTIWTRYFGQPSYDEWLTGITATSDGGVVCIITQYDTIPSATMLIKLDSTGALTWSKRFAPIYWTYDIRETSDQDLVFTLIAQYAFGIIKVDAQGNLVWFHNYSISNQYLMETIEFTETTDGGYVLAATTSLYDVFVMKIDSTGLVMWQRSFAGSGMNICSDIIQTRDTALVILFGRASAPYSKVVLLKLDMNGDTLWCKSYSSNSTGNEYNPGGLSESSGGDLLFSAITLVGASINKIELIRTDPDGNWEWSQRIGGFLHDWPHEIVSTISGEIILTGCSKSYGSVNGYCNLFVAKFDSTGHSGCNEAAMLVQSAPEQLTYSPLPLVPGIDSIASISVTGSLNFKSAFSSLTNCASVGISNFEEEYGRCTIYPNPIVSIATINIPDSRKGPFKISIFDILGREVQTLYSSTHEVIIDRSGLVSGIYQFQITSESGTIETGQFVAQ